jgi:two-component system LytT family response regulator
MNTKIKVAVVDDDDAMHDILHDYYNDSGLIEIKFDFTDSRKFMEAAPSLDFDLCLLDITMPGADGLLIAQLLKNKPFIFITGSDDKLKAALGLEPMDIVTKPFNKTRLDHAIEKAHKMIVENNQYALFSVAECNRKVSIHLPDILFVGTDEYDPRHKPIILKGGVKYTIMDCSLEELLSLTNHLVQVNRRELISLEVINEVEHDLISVKNTCPDIMPKEVTLSRAYKKTVSKRIFFK